MKQSTRGPQPADIAKAGSESAHQKALFCWVALEAAIGNHPELNLLFAVPNGGQRSKITASNLKAEGCKAGVPDMFLPVARGPWHGLFIELKIRDRASDVSDEQKRWIEQLRSQGFGAVVCVGWEVARDTLLTYLNWRN